jgi:hypothetical protein
MGAGDEVRLSEDGGETWSKLFAAKSALPAATVDEDGVLYFGGPAEGVYRIALGDVGTISPLQVSTTPARALAAGGGRVYSVGDEPKDGYAVAVSEDEAHTFTPFFRLCKTAIDVQCGPASSVVAACSLGIETEPWSPLGSACGGKTEPSKEPVVAVMPVTPQKAYKSSCAMCHCPADRGLSGAFALALGISLALSRRFSGG